jgi:hypothetical protein
MEGPATILGRWTATGVPMSNHGLIRSPLPPQRLLSEFVHSAPRKRWCAWPEPHTAAALQGSHAPRVLLKGMADIARNLRFTLGNPQAIWRHLNTGTLRTSTANAKKTEAASVPPITANDRRPLRSHDAPALRQSTDPQPTRVPAMARLQREELL